MAFGVKSRLVLEKLGFDLRRCYEDALQEPVPPAMSALLARLPGAEGHVIELEDARGRPAQP